MFSNQTGQLPIQSLVRGNKYIMVMVEINSNAILVEPMKNSKDAKMIRAYNALLLRLKRASIVPKKHFLDRGSTKKNIIFSNSLWTNSEYPNSLKYMSI